MSISTVKAFEIAISAIQQLPETQENKEAIIKLTKLMRQDRYIHWTKELVFEQLDKWKAEHGRNPNMTNLTEFGMPSPTSIQRLFDMKASAFLSIYYPSKNKKPATTIYSVKSRQEWIDEFVEQFTKIKPKSSREYNTKRDTSTPNWETIAKYLNVSKWSELIKITGVDIKSLRIQETYRSKHYTVNSTSSLYEKLERLLEKK